MGRLFRGNTLAVANIITISGEISLYVSVMCCDTPSVLTQGQQNPSLRSRIRFLELSTVSLQIQQWPIALLKPEEEQDTSVSIMKMEE